jgi:hydroxymethylglutaryl-CoA lyase
MTLPTFVSLVEVSPRDGLQHEATFIATEDKVRFIDLLSQSGLSHIEATSFVSPKKIPQMADNRQVMQAIEKHPGVTYSALVPNLRGLRDAVECGITSVAVFGAVSETFSQRNINCSIADSLLRFAPVITQAKQQDIQVRGYVSCAFGCPYEGDIPLTQVSEFVERLFAMGCDQVALGDTIGVATPKQVLATLASLTQHHPRERLALHFHDTYGQALANIYAALTYGITTFDCSVSGLGGCPYAHSATGNVATEDVVYLLNGLGIRHDVDLASLIKAGQFIDTVLQRSTQSRVARAWEAKHERQ